MHATELAYIYDPVSNPTLTEIRELLSAHEQYLRIRESYAAIRDLNDDSQLIDMTIPEHISEIVSCHLQEVRQSPYDPNSPACIYKAVCDDRFLGRYDAKPPMDYTFVRTGIGFCADEGKRMAEVEQRYEDAYGAFSAAHIAAQINNLLTFGYVGNGLLDPDYPRFQSASLLDTETFYALEASGDLVFRAGEKHINHGGLIRETISQSAPDFWKWRSQPAGEGWGQLIDVAGGGPDVLYALTQEGFLLRYERLTPTRLQAGLWGSDLPYWASPAIEADDWQDYAHIFASGDQVIYGVTYNGELFWNKRNSSSTGPRWTARRVGTGWGNFIETFSLGHGVIYAIKADGDLLSYRHLGFEDGADIWRRPVTVGTYWASFKQVFSTSRTAGNPGVIFAITQTGALLRYVHKTWEHPLPPPSGGSHSLWVSPTERRRQEDLAFQSWEAPEIVGSGWDTYTTIFVPTSPNVIAPR